MQTEELFQVQRRLRRQLLDDRHTRVMGDAADLAAHLLLYLDDARHCWDMAVSWLRDALDADRVDGGFSAPGDPVFIPFAESLRASRMVPSSVGHQVDAHDPSVSYVWAAPTAVPFRDIEEDKRIHSVVRAQLLSIGARSKMAVALRDGSRPVGLLCADWMECGKSDNAGRCEYLDYIARCVLGPVLAAVRQGAQSAEQEENGTPATAPAGSTRALLTPAELKVAQLVVAGMSYKEIARQLNRSIYTIDHQLRSIREKLGVCSTSKAIHILAGEFVQ